MTTNDERNELLRDASSLAYTAIRFSGLYKELSSAEWDGLAERLGKNIVEFMEGFVDAELIQRETAKESSNAHHP